MAISTFAELKTAVANYAHRADLTSVIPDFITIAESAIRRDIRVQAMEQTATGTLSATTLATPTRFLEANRVVLAEYVQRYITPEQWYPLREDITDHYTIIGTNFHFQRSSGDYSIEYYQGFAAFSANGDTNWLLTNHPGVYVFAAMAELSTYIGADPSAWIARYKQEVSAVMAADQRARFAGRISIRPDFKVV